MLNLKSFEVNSFEQIGSRKVLGNLQGRNNMSKIKIQADTNNGIYEVENFEKGVDIYTAELFLFFLDNDRVSDDEIIGAEVSEKELSALRVIYG